MVSMPPFMIETVAAIAAVAAILSVAYWKLKATLKALLPSEYITQLDWLEYNASEQLLESKPTYKDLMTYVEKIKSNIKPGSDYANKYPELVSLSFILEALTRDLRELTTGTDMSQLNIDPALRSLGLNLQSFTEAARKRDKAEMYDRLMTLISSYIISIP